MNFEEFKQKHPGIFFNPVMHPVYSNGMEITHRKAIHRDDDGSFVSIVSNDYVPVSIETVAQHFIQIAESADIPYTFVTGSSFRNGAFANITVDFPTLKISVDGSDESHLRGSLFNGNDGFNAAMLDIGFFRLWCSNGAGIYTKDSSLKFWHIGSVNTKIIDGFKGFLDNSTSIAQNFIRYLSQMTFHDREAVLSTIESSEWLAKKYREAVTVEWQQGGYSLSGWMVFNAYTKIITHSITSEEVKLMASRSLAKTARNWLSQE